MPLRNSEDVMRYWGVYLEFIWFWSANDEEGTVLYHAFNTKVTRDIDNTRHNLHVHDALSLGTEVK